MEKAKRNYSGNSSYYKSNKHTSELNKTIEQKDTANNELSNSSSKNLEFQNYCVKINVHALNIRKGPGFNYPVISTIRDSKTYTITSEKSDNDGKIWGKLKSQEGWILLDYVEKLR